MTRRERTVVRRAADALRLLALCFDVDGDPLAASQACDLSHDLNALLRRKP